MEEITKRSHEFQEKLSKEELITLLNMGQITWASLDLNIIIELALKTFVKNNRAKFACIFLLDENKELSLLNYSFSEASGDIIIDKKHIKLLENLFLGLIKENRPFFIADIYKEPLPGDWNEVGKSLDFLSFISLPLIPKDRVIGMVGLFFKRDYEFASDKLSLLTSSAYYIALAIENARLYKESRLQAHELRKLNEQHKEANEALARKHEELERLNDELKTLDQMKSNLLSNVSHELRTPLVAIKGYTDLILKEKFGHINSQQRRGLQISLKSIERLIILIDNLLDFSKMEMGVEKLKLSNFDLTEVAKEEIQLIKTRARSRKIKLTANLPDSPVMVRGDRDKISQVFVNLLGNSVKFNNHQGKIHVDISFSGEEWIIVKISDTGIGIPKEAFEKIFERFYQVDSSRSRKYGGTGIGLSIANNIIRLHGGKISVISELDKGSCFSFALPVLLDEEERFPVKTWKKSSLKGVIEVYCRNKLYSGEIKNLLEKKGFGVLHTSYQSEALYIAEKSRPELIIWVMDTVDQETLDKLKFLKENSYTSSIPLIIISKVPGIEKKYKINADVFLSFPLDNESFIFVVEKFLCIPVYITGDRPSVLIITDNPQVDNYLNCAVTHLGLIPLSTSIKEEGLKAGLSCSPSIIVLDSKKPEDYIQDILWLIGERDISLLVIGITEDERFTDNSKVHFLLRPFTLSDFQAKLQTLTNRKPISFLPVTRELTLASEEKKSILVVDDEEEIANFIAMALTAEGYSVKTAFSGGEALKTIKDEDFGLVLLDIAMADIDGIEVCQEIKGASRTRMIPVYMITALLTEEIKKRSLEAGADGYLAKPFKINTLIETVANVLGPV